MAPVSPWPVTVDPAVGFGTPIAAGGVPAAPGAVAVEGAPLPQPGGAVLDAVPAALPYALTAAPPVEPPEVCAGPPNGTGIIAAAIAMAFAVRMFRLSLLACFRGGREPVETAAVPAVGGQARRRGDGASAAHAAAGTIADERC